MLEISEHSNIRKWGRDKMEKVYKCTKKCAINKHCFIIKLREPLREKATVMFKCPAVKKDILIEIGGDKSP